MANDPKQSDIVPSPTQSLAKPSTVVSRGLSLVETSRVQPPRDAKPGQVWLDPTDGREMVFVPAGEFIMGSSDADDEKPQHRVTMAGFWIDKVPVNNEAYKKFLDTNPIQAVPFHDYDWARPFNWDSQRRTFPPGRAFHPAVLVSWEDAVAYCRWAGKRLPTEAEWEKAARGTDGREWPWGNQWDAKKCNTTENGPQSTTPVGACLSGASPYGCLDMAGNVWEWTSSIYVRYPYHPGDGREDQDDHSHKRVVRGGCWSYYSHHARCAHRDVNTPTVVYHFKSPVGFRCARTL